MKILLGVTGCIAAYKSCEILRALQKAGADVSVVMTKAATSFVGEQTFAALSGHSVALNTFGNLDDAIVHIRLAKECDAFLIAPCTANILAKLACGIADDLLTSTALACVSPIIVAPAMNVHMYENVATQENIKKLKARGFYVLDPSSGYLACGDVGLGKLPDPQDIADATISILEKSVKNTKLLNGRKVLITSGPTIEPIDSVRFISNRSSGKMGAALALAALEAGANVEVVSGPVSAVYPREAKVVSVETAQQMLYTTENASHDADIVICAAAVADFRPAEQMEGKLKKGIDDAALCELRMVRNPDILKTLAESKKDSQVIIGFAAETSNIRENALSKLKLKNADMIVANEVGAGIAFGTDNNKAMLVTRAGVEELEMMPKIELARHIINKACNLLSHSS
ncbi:bifunctional phosphopantothenoylcysteine decarboxylase/phosphopantothenate--cysteine ligase CoaBC [Adlercreutzia sp. ZJ304]|uniref:bifunctional phosphopantothenoylcysteine decarboxylase/phosphopantothenate--cysteine ligase CoaBC n=1 Tax=Adlercreutzia sp. ZJ304 TaxID=2709791 RepID=UPI001F15023E|nr:bifunctional phosphopantothenoylcysteine decarboxylase/phosphopantothenate--cysteine ligase CoaBC [Adlercreutzia sp. ZJ304]